MVVDYSLFLDQDYPAFLMLHRFLASCAHDNARLLFIGL